MPADREAAFDTGKHPVGSTWESFFRALARKHGLEVESLHYDPSHGWTILLADGREYECRTTTSVTAWIKRSARV